VYPKASSITNFDEIRRAPFPSFTIRGRMVLASIKFQDVFLTGQVETHVVDLDISVTRVMDILIGKAGQQGQLAQFMRFKFVYCGRELEQGSSDTLRSMGVVPGATVGYTIVTPPVTVTVRTADGVSRMVQADVTASVAMFKQRVAQTFGVPPQAQRLVVWGSEMSMDNAPLTSYAVTAGATIQLFVTQLQSAAPRTPPAASTVQVTSLTTGETKPIVATTMDSVANVKTRTGVAFNVNPDLVRLFFNNVELSDDCRPLGMYGIGPGARLGMQQNQEITVTVADLMGQTKWLTLEHTESVESFKAKVESLFHVPVAAQRLVYKGRQLSDDDATMGSYGIDANAALQLIERPTLVTVDIATLWGQHERVEMDLTESFGSFKTKIAAIFDVPVAAQRLILAGKELDGTDATTMSSFPIAAGTRLHLIERPSPIPSTGSSSSSMVSIHVATLDGDAATIHTSLDDVLATFKAKVATALDTPVEMQRLILSGRQLSDDDQATLRSCGVHADDRLHLVKRIKPSVTVAFNGRSERVEVELESPISKLQALVEERFHVPVAYQRLTFRGQTLDSGRLLDWYNIASGDTIELTKKPKTASLELATWRNVINLADVDLTSTVLDLKIRVTILLQTPMPRLQHRGQELIDDQTLVSCGIQDGDRLTLLDRNQTMTVRIKQPSGDSLTLDVPPTTSVRDLKDTVAQRLGIQDVQTLRLAYAGIWLTEDQSPLGSNGISHDAELQLRFLRPPTASVVKVHVYTLSKRVTVDMALDGTVATLKALAQEALGVSVSSQRLFFGGQAL
ncbi:hypothetical protein As57867_005738, partial [Aphanomyces stellatus]